MTTENNALVKAFDLVAATRQKNGLKTTFNPLTGDKVTALKTLLAQVLDTDAAQKNLSFRESLLSASGAIDKYNAAPATVQVELLVDTEAGTMWDHWGSPGAIQHAGYTTVQNPERPRILAKMQKNLYKTLKSSLAK